MKNLEKIKDLQLVDTNKEIAIDSAIKLGNALPWSKPKLLNLTSDSTYSGKPYFSPGEIKSCITAYYTTAGHTYTPSGMCHTYYSNPGNWTATIAGPS